MLFIAQTDGGGGSSYLLTLVIIFGVIYFLRIRPQRARFHNQQRVAAGLEIGDQVRTVGGLFGVVIGLEPDSVILGIEEGRVRVALAAIGGTITPEDESVDPVDDPTDGPMDGTV